MRRLRGVPFARRYLVGQSCSILGDSALWLALGIWVRELTGSNALAGLSFFFLAAPQLAAPLWGTLVDRLPRRPVLLVGNVVSAALTLLLLAVHDRHQVWLIWVVMTAFGVSSSVLGAAQSGFLRTLLPDDALGDAQAWLSTVREGLRLVSPLLGAGVFAVAGGHVVALVDAATFVVAAGSVATIRVVEPAAAPVGPRWGDEIAGGWSHIRATVALRQVVGALAAVCLVIGLVETAGFAVITTGLHEPASWIGAWQVTMGAGALVGGPTVSAAMRRWGEGRVAAAGMIAWSVAAALLTVPALAPVVAGGVVAGFGLPWMVAASATFVQRRTPDRLQGRVSATVDLLTGAPQSVSIAVGAALVTAVGYRALLAVVAVVTLGAGTWLATRPEHGRRRAVVAPPAVADGATGPAVPTGPR